MVLTNKRKTRIYSIESHLCVTSKCSITPRFSFEACPFFFSLRKISANQSVLRHARLSHENTMNTFSSLPFTTLNSNLQQTEQNMFTIRPRPCRMTFLTYFIMHMECYRREGKYFVRIRKPHKLKYKHVS